MPRSGTSLVEQIAASHPDVFGAGEIDSLDGFRQGFPENVAGLGSAAAGKILACFAGESRRVIDKTPTNFHYLGLIARLLPNARIVHCRRDVRDSGLSCYFQNFKAPLAWSTDLVDIGRYTRAYETIMAHWRTVLPKPILEIDYEALVVDIEGESRRLIDFLGLEWDDACLSFHKTRRIVLTASATQVRRPVYASSVGRWRAYERELQPLIETLA